MILAYSFPLKQINGYLFIPSPESTLYGMASFEHFSSIAQTLRNKQVMLKDQKDIKKVENYRLVTWIS